MDSVGRGSGSDKIFEWLSVSGRARALLCRTRAGLGQKNSARYTLYYISIWAEQVWVCVCVCVWVCVCVCVCVCAVEYLGRTGVCVCMCVCVCVYICMCVCESESASQRERGEHA